MTRDEAAALIIAQGYATPELYAIVEGQPWNGKSRFIWLKENYDIGYRIKHSPSKGGHAINPDSDLQRQPWLELGISQATYYRRKALDAKWKEVFLTLNALDTPANRQAYTTMQKTSKVLGVGFRELWEKYTRTLNASGESTPVLLSSDDKKTHTHPPDEACVGKGFCLACHEVHL